MATPYSDKAKAIQSLLIGRGHSITLDGRVGDQTLDAILSELRKLPQVAASLSPGIQNPAAFFSAIRTTGLFRDGLAQAQVDGINRLLNAFALARWPIAFAAYGLATSKHETGKRMQPVKEGGGNAYLDKYDTGRLAAILGNTPEDDDDGIKYAGRGDVQITGRRNYVWASSVTGFDLEENPDLALDPAVSATILVKGLETGAFTGKRLADYLPAGSAATLDQFREARRTVNGTDRAEDIAGMAMNFQRSLTAGGWR